MDLNLRTLIHMNIYILSRNQQPQNFNLIDVGLGMALLS